MRQEQQRDKSKNLEPNTGITTELSKRQKLTPQVIFNSIKERTKRTIKKINVLEAAGSLTFALGVFDAGYTIYQGEMHKQALEASLKRSEISYKDFRSEQMIYNSKNVAPEFLIDSALMGAGCVMMVFGEKKHPEQE